MPFISAIVHPKPYVSPRTRKKSHQAEVHFKELIDTSYRKRMEAARKLLADDLLEIESESLATLRLKKGLSQSQLAMKLNTSQSHIAKIEAGNLDLKWGTVTKLADVLGVTLDQIRPFIKIAPKTEPSTGHNAFNQL